MGFTALTAAWNGAPAVHPHARGVYFRIGRNHTGNVRFIPTHVGFTSPPSTWPRRFSVHPHARGVYGQPSVDLLLKQRFIPTHVGFTQETGEIADFESGSSPRTWGLLEPYEKSGKYQRFIPTHVGFTSTLMKSSLVIPVHPHARGVYTLRPSNLTSGLRFIPTHVGFTKAGRRTVLLPSPVLNVLKTVSTSRWMFPSPVKEDSSMDPAAV